MSEKKNDKKETAFERWKAWNAKETGADLQAAILDEMTPAQRQAYEAGSFEKPSDYMAAFERMAQSW